MQPQQLHAGIVSSSARRNRCFESLAAARGPIILQFEYGIFGGLQKQQPVHSHVWLRRQKLVEYISPQLPVAQLFDALVQLDDFCMLVIGNVGFHPLHVTNEAAAGIQNTALYQHFLKRRQLLDDNVVFLLAQIRGRRMDGCVAAETCVAGSGFDGIQKTCGSNGAVECFAIENDLEHRFRIKVCNAPLVLGTVMSAQTVAKQLHHFNIALVGMRPQLELAVDEFGV